MNALESCSSMSIYSTESNMQGYAQRIAENFISKFVLYRNTAESRLESNVYTCVLHHKKKSNFIVPLLRL